MFDEKCPDKIIHIDLAKWANIFLIAPASANMISKIANGIADDLLSATSLVIRCTKVIAPAMNTNMYENYIIQENLKKLEKDNYKIIEPRKSLLACGDFGTGALEEIPKILDFLENLK